MQITLESYIRHRLWSSAPARGANLNASTYLSLLIYAYIYIYIYKFISCAHQVYIYNCIVMHVSICVCMCVFLVNINTHIRGPSGSVPMPFGGCPPRPLGSIPSPPFFLPWPLVLRLPPPHAIGEWRLLPTLTSQAHWWVAPAVRQKTLRQSLKTPEVLRARDDCSFLSEKN